MVDYLFFTKFDLQLQKVLLKTYKTILSTFPQGNLVYKKERGKIRFYHTGVEKGRHIYIRNQNTQLLEELKEKKLVEMVISKLQNNIDLEKEVLTRYENYTLKHVIRQLKQPYRDVNINAIEEKCLKNYRWSDKINHSPYHDHLMHSTVSGINVRSKSELSIATMLDAAGISYQYEMELKLKDENGIEHIYYPDFTLLTLDGRKIYWEHFGKLNDPQYRQKTMKKLSDYNLNNIYSPFNLIISMDGPNGSLDLAGIQRVIDSLIPLCVKPTSRT